MHARDPLPHSVIPLALAVWVVRSRLAEAKVSGGMDPNAMATFIASTVPVFEYWESSSQTPRLLPHDSRDGVFREGGRELRFPDGRPTKHLLAVQVDDIGCVVEMLKYPERALYVRNRMLRTLARRLTTRSRDLGARSAELRGTAERLVRTAQALEP